MIGLLYLIYKKSKTVYIMDIHKPKSHGHLVDSWKDYLSPDSVRFVESNFFDVLPSLLEELQKEHGSNLSSSVAVVACHACAHLSDAIMEMCFKHKVEFAIMPCCHTDNENSSIKTASKSLGITLGAARDLITMGRIIQAGYECKWRTIPPEITPLNRILIATQPIEKTLHPKGRKSVKQATDKLLSAYDRAHKTSSSTSSTSTPNT
eukprot:TRINITY_DN3959_c0_g1_i2.p1 TRINITY_DN3959_c0_g1~~TRINITY_DN3959_c0_g1_i2.p1  ORF type:complete len:207 (-),score=26.86 TRINITY_DN3959_c0_g1_i2:47-667(-)